MVPTPVGVRKPPSPAPPERILPANVPCGNELTFELVLFHIGVHALCHLRIEAHVCGDQLFDLAVAQKLAHALARQAGVVANYGQISDVLLHQRVDEVLRRSAGHEAAHHDGRAIADVLYCFLCSHHFVFHVFSLMCYDKCS